MQQKLEVTKLVGYFLPQVADLLKTFGLQNTKDFLSGL